MVEQELHQRMTRWLGHNLVVVKDQCDRRRHRDEVIHQRVHPRDRARAWDLKHRLGATTDGSIGVAQGGDQMRAEFEQALADARG